MTGMQSLICPSCGGTLEVTDQNATTIQCKYCGTEAPVPQEMQRAAASVRVSQQIPGVARWIVIAVVAIVAITACAICAPPLLFSGAAIWSLGQAAQDAPTAEALLTLQAPQPTPATSTVATTVLSFGAKGAGAGQFDDPTALAVDRDGNIYVCDRLDGRLQKFDASGKFLWLQTLEGKRAGSLSLVLDSNGHLYAVDAGNILQFDAASGKLLATFKHGENTYYVTLAIAPDNTLYAFSIEVDDDIVQLDTSGKILTRWKKVLTSQDDNIASPEAPIAVDGLGNVYAAVGNTNQVFMFDKAGKYLNRWGEEGSDPGQLDGLFGIAVDGQGHLFIADVSGVEIFTTSGHFLLRIPENDAWGQYHNVALDGEGDIYALGDEGKVVRFHLKTPLEPGK
jgi:streptogramin lyase